jgi:epoxyqueuosine reductase QueG
MRAEGLQPSPLGILMHPEYGVWHAYRGALLFDVEISIQAPRKQIHLCDLCIGKPCMKSCPVGAHSQSAFDYGACADHVRGPSGGPCRTTGCIDRNACPYGADYRYAADTQAFHMAAFAR